MTSGAAVEAIGLQKWFTAHHGWRDMFGGGQRKTALHEINLSIAPGEVFGLLGPNGAGKTTLVKILSTLVYPSRGRALVVGLDVVRHSREVRRRVGVVYGDERTFFLRLSAIENLRFYATLHGLTSAEADERIRKLLDLVGMTAAASVRMQQYSSGMKQRIAIARGLLNEPDLLIMDEPTHNLDPLAAREVRDLVRERVADGRRTVVLATNIMAEAEDLCDRLAILHHGRIQLSGSIDQLRTLLESEEGHQMEIGAFERLSLESLHAVPGVRSITVAAQTDARLRLDVSVERKSAAIPLLIRSLVEAGGHVWSSTPRELSLDEMFEIAIRRSQDVTPTSNGHARSTPAAFDAAAPGRTAAGASK